MKLNEPKGNMYEWAFTCNPLGGECPHRCSYCYGESIKGIFKATKNKYSGKPKLMEDELKSSIKTIPDDKVVFVCSMTDLFADDVPSEYIKKILLYVWEHPKNQYLLQTKNPKRFIEFGANINKGDIIGITLETNRDDMYETNAPKSRTRYSWMISREMIETFLSMEKMISIEPIMDFDIDIFSEWILNIKPNWVSIGADSFKNNIIEPPRTKVDELIQIIKDNNIEVRQKRNLDRLQ